MSWRSQNLFFIIIIITVVLVTRKYFLSARKKQKYELNYFEKIFAFDWEYIYQSSHIVNLLYMISNLLVIPVGEPSRLVLNLHLYSFYLHRLCFKTFFNPQVDCYNSLLMTTLFPTLHFFFFSAFENNFMRTQSLE